VRPLHALDPRRRPHRRSLRHARLPRAGIRDAGPLQRLPRRAGARRRRRPRDPSAVVGAADAGRQVAGADQRARRDGGCQADVLSAHRRGPRALSGSRRRLVRMAARRAPGAASGALPSHRRRRRAVRLRRAARARLGRHPHDDAERRLRPPARPDARRARRTGGRGPVARSRHERRGRRRAARAAGRRARRGGARQRTRQLRRRRGSRAADGRADAVL
ncbi:MAG: hypothetical protein AVDCRST_MAG65-1557, partial [uncultured Solirubrobacteraceae bacterium]